MMVSKNIPCPSCGQVAVITLSQLPAIVPATEGHTISISCRNRCNVRDAEKARLWAADPVTQ